MMPAPLNRFKTGTSGHEFVNLLPNAYVGPPRDGWRGECVGLEDATVGPAKEKTHSPSRQPRLCYRRRARARRPPERGLYAYRSRPDIAPGCKNSSSASRRLHRSRTKFPRGYRPFAHTPEPPRAAAVKGKSRNLPDPVPERSVGTV